MMMKNLTPGEASQENLPASLAQFIDDMKSRFGQSGDIIYRELQLGAIPAVMVYIEDGRSPLSNRSDSCRFAAVHESPDQRPEERMKMLQELTITMGKVGSPDLSRG